MTKADAIIEGLTILKKYGGVSVDAQHAVLYAGPSTPGERLALVDQWRMRELGWFATDNWTSWGIYT